MPSDFAGEKALAVHKKAHRGEYVALPVLYPIVETAHMVKFLTGA